MTSIAIFASGGGSNAISIIKHLAGQASFVVLSNKKDAAVLQKIKDYDVEGLHFTRKDFYESDKILALLHERKVEWIVLAGFLWLVPENLLEAYPQRILNIHPSLLPKYGGRGMFGKNVHSAVIEAGESESGLSIHYVNSEYDKGQILLQARCPVIEGDTADSLAARVLQLEHFYYPRVLEFVLSKPS
ncbi:MAG: phosphoribosylglycinamide formyltransferase [Bernardetiaceae bacterium]|nr:phosphoribosylglycinamide formyltransferase [Bernardetiaceae bacterium]